MIFSMAKQGIGQQALGAAEFPARYGAWEISNLKFEI
jgi:hypothetical protein